ncbi:MAG: cbb3-type cytochrome c oxidase subunit 3 [Pseudomonadota bacterium]
MDFTFIQSVWTIVIMVVFLGIVVWAWSGKRKQRFDEAANIPFHEDEQSSIEGTNKENSHG